MSSKRYKKLISERKFNEAKPLEDLIKLIKLGCTTKFDESIDLNLQINNKQKKNELSLRTVVNLPAGLGKKVKIGVVCEESKIK